MKKQTKQDKLRAAVAQMIDQVEVLTGTGENETWFGSGDLDTVMKNLEVCTAKVKKLLKS